MSESGAGFGLALYLSYAAEDKGHGSDDEHGETHARKEEKH